MTRPSCRSRTRPREARRTATHQPPKGWCRRPRSMLVPDDMHGSWCGGWNEPGPVTSPCRDDAPARSGLRVLQVVELVLELDQVVVHLRRPRFELLLLGGASAHLDALDLRCPHGNA